MNRRPRAPIIPVAMILLGLLLLGYGTSGARAGVDGTRVAVTSLAVAYCGNTGGKVVTRYPTYGATSANPLRLAGMLQFCQYQAADGSRIHLSLETLYADQPTLAVLAYLNKPPSVSAPPGVNPASVYCTQLGGTDQFGGVNATGGGWVTDDPNLVDRVLQACIFPDLSTIDSFGLFYHTNGVIRGTDLTTVVRYRPNQTPATPSTR
jgi:putative hemolysin